MSRLGRVIDFILRFVLHLASWLTFPLFAIVNGLLSIVFGLASLIGIVGYVWFMWGLAMLIFDHQPGATQEALHTIGHASLWFLGPLAVMGVVMIYRGLYGRYHTWLDRGGFLIPSAPADARFNEQEARWNLWGRFRAY